MNEPAVKTRRSFIDIFMKGGLFLWATGMIAPTLAYIWPARARGGRATTVSAGSEKDFSVGTARMTQKDGQPILVIRVKEDSYTALSAICTHLGCIVKWDLNKKQIQCPCHAAVFGPDGQVVAGPPPRPLEQYQVLVAGGEVMVKV